MSRKVIFVCAAALMLASCGRQVTPSRGGTGGLAAGQMLIKYTTQGSPDFVNNWYVLAFNTDGAGEPYAPYGNTANNWLNYSWEIIIAQQAGSASPQISLWEFVGQTNGGSLKQPYGPIQYTPQDIVPNYNCNGTQTQFCLTINREIFTLGQPLPAQGNTWFINWLVASPSAGASGTPSGAAIYAPFGPQDTTQFKFSLDVTAASDQTWTGYAPPTWPQAPSQASQLLGGEVANSP